jgi:hypothetical protein
MAGDEGDVSSIASWLGCLSFQTDRSLVTWIGWQAATKQAPLVFNRGSQDGYYLNKFLLAASADST